MKKCLQTLIVAIETKNPYSVKIGFFKNVLAHCLRKKFLRYFTVYKCVAKNSNDLKINNSTFLLFKKYFGPTVDENICIF